MAEWLLAAVQVKEHQLDLDEKSHLLSQLREQIVLLERRCSLLTAEEEELRGILEQTDRSRKAAEHELVEAAETVHLLAAQVRIHTRSNSHDSVSTEVIFCFQNTGLVSKKKKLEADLSVLSGEVEDVLQERRSAEEHAKKALTDVSPGLSAFHPSGSRSSCSCSLCVFPGCTHGRGAEERAGQQQHAGENKEEHGLHNQRCSGAPLF